MPSRLQRSTFLTRRSPKTRLTSNRKGPHEASACLTPARRHFCLHLPNEGDRICAKLPTRHLFHALRIFPSRRSPYWNILEFCRHTPLAIVAKQLGHTNTDTVSRTYGHLCCDSLEAEISRRFSPLLKAKKDGRLQSLRNTLQTKEEPSWSWPRKNRSKEAGAIVELLRAKEDELRIR